jgi:hypothetical protein
MAGVRPGVVVLAALGLAGLSLLFPSAPGYDPLAWLVWGRETAGLELDTSSGPAWKPLPVAVTAVLSPTGDAAASLWLVLARAAGLLAALAAFRLAARLVPSFGILAGAGAVAGLLLVEGFVRGVALGNSEGLLVLAVLLAWERHLAGRPGQALALCAVAALLRVEAWPFVALYAALLWRREPGLRRWIMGAALAVPAFWFLPELWGSGDLLRSSERARIPNPGAPALAERPAREVLSRFAGMLPAPLLAAAALAVARRRGLLLAGAAAAWVALVAVMSELGYSGEERYLVPAAAGVAVLAGGGLAEAAAALALRARWAGRAAVAGTAALLLALGTATIPGARGTAADLRHAARLHADLAQAVERAGGLERVRACGAPFAGRYRFPALAWRLRVHISEVSLDPGRSGVVFRSRLTPRSVPAPGLPAGYARVAAAGEWSVYARCGPLA